ELHVSPPDLRLQLGGRGVVAIVHPEVRVHLLVSRDGEVDEMLVRIPAPRRARAEVEPPAGVLAVRDGQLLPRAIALPVKTAAGVDEPFGPKIAAVEQIPDEGVGVVELGIGGDDDAGLQPGWLLGRACRRTSSERYHEKRLRYPPRVHHLRKLARATRNGERVAPEGYLPRKSELRFDMFEAEYTHEGSDSPHLNY